ncbi:Fic family protein [Candidatus Woesearchaeota archaeon]|nr:Fic family protein [Candidatus Woesearchaeota archaeon]
MDLTKKDIIAINQRFSTGYFENESSLSSALEHSRHSIAWTKQLAYLIRAILIDHVFVDGNKRTAYALLLNYIDLNEWKIKEDLAITLIKNLVLKGEKSIANIQRRIENAITK